jgi:hypothetical protein
MGCKAWFAYSYPRNEVPITWTNIKSLSYCYILPVLLSAFSHLCIYSNSLSKRYLIFRRNMKPYGKPSEIRHSCMCCSTQVEHRTQSKSELRRLIIEETNTLPSETCKVCTAKDYKCTCYWDISEIWSKLALLVSEKILFSK